jgi:hypothetical protein
MSLLTRISAEASKRIEELQRKTGRAVSGAGQSSRDKAG